MQDFPAQFWPSQPSVNGVPAGPLRLTCGSTATEPQPQIDFVGTQFSIPVDDLTHFSGSPTDCNEQASDNSCSQIFSQSMETSGDYMGNWQPGVPLTIEGSGFGFLPESSLPYATESWPSTQYLTITDAQEGWTSPSMGQSGSCQIFILNWAQTNITVIPNIVSGEMNGQSTALSPLTDTSPSTLGGSSSCQVKANDTIRVTVTNPQTGVSTPLQTPVTVGTYSGSLN